MISAVCRSEREVHQESFLKQLWGKPCSATSRSVVPLPAPVSIPTPDEPESFFIGDTPSSEDDPFGWGGDFDQEHQAVSDQQLPFRPDKRVESAQMDFRSSLDPTCCHAMEEADPQCASCMPEPSAPRLNEQVCPKATLECALQNKQVSSKAMLGLTTGPLLTI